MMAEPVLKPDTDAISAHLAHITSRWDELGEPVLLELVFLSAEDRATVKDVRRYSHDRISEAVAHIAGMNQHRVNAYAVVNPVLADAPLEIGTRASRDHIAAAFFHWADADDGQAAENIRNFVGPPFTFCVLTGTHPTRRPHVYWELEDPTRNFEAWERTQRAIAASLKTDPAVVDPPRIMRIAGTINWPKPKKQAKGYVAELTTLHLTDNPSVSSERMARAFSSAPKLSSPAPIGQAAPDGSERVPTSELVRRIHSGQGWHDAVIRIVGRLVRNGLSDDDIHAFTDGFTQPGFTLDDTRREVEAAIDGARRKGYRREDQGCWEPDPYPEGGRRTPPDEEGPAFDHGAPGSGGWVIQTSTEFTSGFVPPEYIIDGVAQRGRLLTLTAPTGSGKTAVMLYGAAMLGTGSAFGDRDVEPGDVLFLAGENPDDVRARWIATMEFYKVDQASCRVHFIPGTFSIRADMDRLRAEAARLPDLVMIVIDTFAAYFDGDDENSNAQALDFARLVRKLTALPTRPTVIMPAHPVKNATRDNLAPKGGSSLLNEVDGNLTLWNEGGICSLHWQGKHRGPDFEPVKFELQRYTSDLLKDRKGRLMPTVLAKPILEMRAREIAADTLKAEDRILLSIETHPALSVADRCLHIGLRLADGAPHKSGMTRLLNRLRDQKLIRKFRTNWELTKDGEKAVEMIKAGDKLSPDLGP